MKLDVHCEMLLSEYHEKLPIYEKMKTVVLDLLRNCLDKNNILVSGLKPASRRSKAWQGSWS